MPIKAAIVWLALMTAAAVPARAQMLDDKIMPPVLVVPPQPVQESYSPADAAADYFSEDADGDENPLSVYEVPMIDVPGDENAPQADKPPLVGTFSLLHKVTAKVREISLRSGEEVTIDELTLVMHDCLSTPPEEPPETKTFLQVFEFKNGADRQLFSGWMFASSPGIHALEHPVYDLWATACKTEDGLDYTGELPPVAAAAPLQ